MKCKEIRFDAETLMRNVEAFAAHVQGREKLPPRRRLPLHRDCSIKLRRIASAAAE